ncbi:ATP-binding cassette domain-containing protein [Spirosoma daeguense]
MAPFFMTDPWISLHGLTVRRSGQIVLKDLYFQLKPGECWAVTGPTGSGKTTFLQTLAGQFSAPATLLTRRGTAEFVSFKEESSQFSYGGYFYQQRYQATMSDNAGDAGYRSIPKLRDFLGFADTLESKALIDRLGLTPLLDRSFLKLSNGQTRKARIGKALLKHPSVLLLDNPFVGLDAGFRAELTSWLAELVEHGLTLMLVTESEEIPKFATHVATFSKGRIQWTGPRKTYLPAENQQIFETVPTLATKPAVADFEEAFSLRNVTVQYSDVVILNQINWTVRAGERWALIGPNGAGKSVLLSLLYGDHPQAYSNNVSVFGFRRGKSGESIWDVKRRIGFVSPELHLYFPQGLLAREVALTGLTDTLTPPRRVSPDSENDLASLFAYFGISGLTNRMFGTLSAGEQRLILLIRAFLKNAPVLLLDEPFQVIDAQHIELARQLIDSFTNKTILFVTHDRRELPSSIAHLYSL